MPLLTANPTSSNKNVSRRRWHFSLRTLFLAMTLIGLLVFACRQFGPLGVRTIVAAAAPFSDCHGSCPGCGMQRETSAVCGRVTKDEISHTEASLWASPLVPPNHTHRWIIYTRHYRTHWFGIAPIGCGGPGEGALLAWQLARCGEQADAVQFFQEYQAIVAGKSAKPLPVHEQELCAAIAAAQKKQPVR
jgi:hypothetical protein